MIFKSELKEDIDCLRSGLRALGEELGYSVSRNGKIFESPRIFGNLSLPHRLTNAERAIRRLQHLIEGEPHNCATCGKTFEDKDG